MEYPSLGTPPAGSIRFNTDSSKMEIYNGDKWWEIDSTSPEEHTGGTRGLYGMGYNTPARDDEIEYVNISTTGNATDFGNLTLGRDSGSSSGSRTRGIWMGGGTPSIEDRIDYVTITSTGDAIDFGDLIHNGVYSCAWADSTRLVKACGEGSPQAVRQSTEYITMASTGDAKDFGDATVGRRRPMSVG